MRRAAHHFLLLVVACLLALHVRADDAFVTNAPDYGKMTSSNLAPLPDMTAKIEADLQQRMDRAHSQRLDKDFDGASDTLSQILHTDAPTEFHRRALFEMALTAQDSGQLVKAQQIFSQYLHIYSEDPSAPEVLLRQGLLYRQMNVNTLALSKFYGVMSTALKLKLENIDYYKRLVVQAQTEIADTYYLDGRFDYAVDFYSRIVKADSPDLNKEQIEYKLVRSLGNLTNYNETVRRAQIFIDHYTNTSDVAEVRFVYALALKELGRNEESMRQVLALLQSQQGNIQKDPELWAYWQRRAGNVIANQLYKEGDYLDALEIYLSLAPLDHSLAWQAPVLYQSGLVYEQLAQWKKATETYTSIVSRTNELTDAVSTPMLRSLFEMAQWRKDYIGWMEQARASNNLYQVSFLGATAKAAGTK
jgi:tetratricopeptide (TPR) repeat protein